MGRHLLQTVRAAAAAGLVEMALSARFCLMPEPHLMGVVTSLIQITLTTAPIWMVVEGVAAVAVETQ